jgi:hypothetical protein
VQAHRIGRARRYGMSLPSPVVMREVNMIWGDKHGFAVVRRLLYEPHSSRQDKPTARYSVGLNIVNVPGALWS